MIWAKNKAGDNCPGCGVKLIDDPGAFSGRGIGVKWLVHEDTKFTICGTGAETLHRETVQIDSIKSIMGKKT